MKRLPLAAGARARRLFTLAAPSFLERGTLNDVWNLAFAVILASAWNLLGGFAGQVSLGYSAFLGIGAYTTVLLSLRGVDPFLTLPLGAAPRRRSSRSSIGLPAFRLRGPYFTIATIGVGEAVRVVGRRASRSRAARAASGCRRARSTSRSTTSRWRCLAILTVALAAVVSRSAFGQALAAIRQDIDAAEALGVNSTRFKLGGARALGRARGPRRRPLRDQLPVHRPRLRLRLPPEPDASS